MTMDSAKGTNFRHIDSPPPPTDADCHRPLTTPTTAQWRADAIEHLAAVLPLGEREIPGVGYQPALRVHLGTAVDRRPTHHLPDFAAQPVDLWQSDKLLQDDVPVFAIVRQLIGCKHGIGL